MLSTHRAASHLQGLPVRSERVEPAPVSVRVDVREEVGDRGVPTSSHPDALELLRGLPLRQPGMSGGLVTPTGAALVAIIADSFGPVPGDDRRGDRLRNGGRAHARPDAACTRRHP
jgi:uncharacterized protein (DUF111 family)